MVARTSHGHRAYCVWISQGMADLSAGVLATPSPRLYGRWENMGLGGVVGGVGDVNGDGLGDLVAGTRGSTPDFLGVYFGSIAAVSTRPSQSLDDEPRATGFGVAFSRAIQ